MKKSQGEKITLLIVTTTMFIGLGFAQSNTNFIPQEQPIPETRNALNYFIRAGAMIKQDDVTATTLMVISGDNNSKEAIAMVQKYSNALTILEQGLQIGNGKSPVRWQNLTTPEAIDQETRRYQGMNSVHNLLLLRMLQREKAGKFLEAIDDAKRALEFARIQRGSWGSVDLWYRSITSQKASMDAIARMSQSHKQNASDLRVITNVLEAPFPIADAQESLKSQSKVGIGVVNTLAKNQGDPLTLISYILATTRDIDFGMVQTAYLAAQSNGGKINAQQTQADMIQDAQNNMAMLNSCDIPEDIVFQQWQKQTANNNTKSNSIGTVLRAVLNAQLTTMVIRDCNARAQRNMTTLKYALWAFEVDKKALPQNLSELLPLYLRAVPVNPNRSSGIQYDAANRTLTCPTRNGLLGEGLGIVRF
jgi:hypothetical protein